ARTWAMLRALPMPTVLGNQDRLLMDAGPEETNPALRAALGGLGAEGLAWLRALPATLRLPGGVLLCHGTPACDTAYLLEDVSTGLPAPRGCASVLADLAEAGDCSLVLAGHSHHPGLLRCGPFTLVNPGSVGLPAYDDDTPPHIMASGSPHAKYAVVFPTAHGWDADFVSVPYDWDAAAALARANGRADWARWLATGMA
ncbi:MAG: metallophosphoesterase family protein, partial [Pseudodesulfovibrio sp.]